MGLFDAMLTSLLNMDFFQILFPFLLALAIFYGVLKMVLKEKLGNGPIGLISIILAFFVMLYARTVPIYLTITAGAGSVLAIACVILFLLILLGLFGISLDNLKDKDKKSWFGIIVALIIIFVIVAGLWGTNIFMGLPWFVGYTDVWTIILFVIIIAICWHIMNSGEGGDKDKEKAAKV
jgi:hypothetical protein